MKKLQEYLQEQSFMYHDKIIIFLYNEYNISINVFAIKKTLKRVKISRKKISISRLLFLEISDY